MVDSVAHPERVAICRSLAVFALTLLRNLQLKSSFVKGTKSNENHWREYILSRIKLFCL